MSKYTVSWLQAERRIEAKTIGFWSMSDFTAYEPVFLATVDRAGGQPFDLLVDVSERMPQTAELVAAFETLTVEAASRGMRRIVIVGSSALLGRQIKRVNATLPSHFADSIDEARHWLEHPE